MKIHFSKKKSGITIGSKLIMYVEEISFSHVSIEVNGHVYESVWPKSRKISLSNWEKKYQSVETVEIETTLFQDDLLEQDMSEMIGVRYSIMQLFWIGVGILFEPISAYISERNLNGSRFLICTEFVGSILENHFDVEFKEQKDMLSVGDVYKYAKELRDGNISNNRS